MIVHQPIGCNGRDGSACPIRHNAVCARCDPTEMAILNGIKHYRSDEAGQTVDWAGVRMEFAALVVTGIAPISRALEDGRTPMVGRLMPLDFAGRPGRELAPFTVPAIPDPTLCCFRKKTLGRPWRPPHI